MEDAWDTAWLSMALPSPPLPTLQLGVEHPEMLTIQVLKGGEVAGGGCSEEAAQQGREAAVETVIVVSARNCAQKHRLSTRFPAQSSAGPGGSGARRERERGGFWRTKERRHAERRGGIEAERERR